VIGSLRGTVLHKSPGELLLDVQGIGYEVLMGVSAFDRIPGAGDEAQIFISESMGMYGGGITLYGFLSLEEKEVFLMLREIPGTGAKKAIDYLDKIMKSAPDFRRAILESDARALVSLFGFTKKTADKMIAALKDKITGLRVAGREKWTQATGSTSFSEAVAALLTLGYREPEARAALERLPSAQQKESPTPDLVREALKLLA
jgi:holliday junction DNA helicase RuvA